MKKEEEEDMYSSKKVKWSKPGLKALVKVS